MTEKLKRKYVQPQVEIIKLESPYTILSGSQFSGQHNPATHGTSPSRDDEEDMDFFYGQHTPATHVTIGGPEQEE